MNAKLLRSTKALLAGGILAVAGLPAYGQHIRSPQQQDVLLNKLTSIVNVQSQLIQQLQDKIQQKGQDGKAPSRQGLTSEVLFGRLSAPGVIPPNRVITPGEDPNTLSLIERTKPSIGEEYNAIPYSRLNQPHAKFSIPGMGELLLWCYKRGIYNYSDISSSYPNAPLGAFMVDINADLIGSQSFYGFRNITSQALNLTIPNSIQFGMIPPNTVNLDASGATILNPAIFNSPYKSTTISIQRLEDIQSYRGSPGPTFVTDASGMNQNTCRAYVTVTTTTETP
jgi:hypothetical protein